MEAASQKEISKEELRALRLAKLCGGEQKGDSPSGRSFADEPAEKKQQLDIARPGSLTPSQIMLLNKRMYEGGGATEEDLHRWLDQGFVFCDYPNFGLKQGRGGPCGILAAVQAEIIKGMIESGAGSSDALSSPSSSSSSSSASSSSTPLPDVPTLSSDEVEALFANAIVKILSRAAEANNNILIVDYIGPAGGFVTMHPDSKEIVVYSFHTDETAVQFVRERMLSSLQSPFGCMLFLWSLMLTRQLERLESDMDISDNTLIGRFGHCTQDLINLLLTGRASSNCMDGNMSMGDDSGIIVKGVTERSSIGYLTHLESLRLCQVGTNYKVPVYPIWVVGSSSHFSVLFCFDLQVNEESPSEKLFNAARRAFKAYECDDCGFITSDRLKSVLQMLELPIVNDELSLAQLRGHLQIDGEIIIWSTFWSNVSKIMVGETLDSIISQGGGATCAFDALVIDESKHQHHQENIPPPPHSYRQRRK